MEKFQSEEFKKEWERWKQYKKEQHRFTYKGTISEEAALTRLFNLSSGNEKTAIELIENAIELSWKGIYLKNNYGQSINSNSNKPHKPGTSEARIAALKNWGTGTGA